MIESELRPEDRQKGGRKLWTDGGSPQTGPEEVKEESWRSARKVRATEEERGGKRCHKDNRQNQEA
jgi:hypothetical protein